MIIREPIEAHNRRGDGTNEQDSPALASVFGPYLETRTLSKNESSTDLPGGFPTRLRSNLI